MGTVVENLVVYNLRSAGAVPAASICHGREYKLVMRVSAYGTTDHGRKRAQNQDKVLCYTLSEDGNPLGLYAVADGMGGQNAGEVASQIAVETLQEDLLSFMNQSLGRQNGGDEALTTRLSPEDLDSDAPSLSMVDALTASIQRSNLRIREHGTLHPECAGLGSTLTIAMIIGNLALVANIGDSRTYMVRQGAITSLTQDHSLVRTLVNQGLITEEDIYSHPHRNLIYNALGTRVEANADITVQRLQTGDILVLCSDGLWEMVRDEEIRILAETLEDPELAAFSLVDLANANGGVDNISVVIVRVM